jgi:prolyl-tRNA synthetase
VLAIPVVKGAKSASERFAGAEETYTIEALMQNGWALQSGTSHFLGQNFAKAFGVAYQAKDGGRELVWATSWGVSTRLLGAMVGDAWKSAHENGTRACAGASFLVGCCCCCCVLRLSLPC